MGANYDLILSPAHSDNVLANCVRDFLESRGLIMSAVGALGAAEILDDNAILFSRPSNGWAQIIANRSAIGISFAAWFQNNPLAAYITLRLGACIHLWSLDSGYVAGYAVYSNGNKSDCECIFSKNAERIDSIIDGVPTPRSRENGELRALMKAHYDFCSNMSRSNNLEAGLAELMSQFGFQTHLIDLYDALDDTRGISIARGKYNFVTLQGWTALLFGRGRKTDAAKG